MQMSDYPEMTFRMFRNISVMNSKGSFYLLIIPMLSFIFITTDILREKEKSLRKGMMTMGLRSTAYWTSWMITSVFWAFLASFMTVLFGYIFQIL